jgi:hypothetical protein
MRACLTRVSRLMESASTDERHVAAGRLNALKPVPRRRLRIVQTQRASDGHHPHRQFVRDIDIRNVLQRGHRVVTFMSKGELTEQAGFPGG